MDMNHTMNNGNVPPFQPKNNDLSNCNRFVGLHQKQKISSVERWFHTSAKDKQSTNKHTMVNDQKDKLRKQRSIFVYLRTTTIGLSLPVMIIKVFHIIKAVETISPKLMICLKICVVKEFAKEQQRQQQNKENVSNQTKATTTIVTKGLAKRFRILFILDIISTMPSIFGDFVFCCVCLQLVVCLVCQRDQKVLPGTLKIQRCQHHNQTNDERGRNKQTSKTNKQTNK